MDAKDSIRPAADEPSYIAGHSAIDVLNTFVGVGDGFYDFWQTDADVSAWLRRMGFLGDEELPRWKTSALLSDARELREVIRSCILSRKIGKLSDLSRLNVFLSESKSHLALERRKGVFTVVRRYEQATPKQLLAPVAESAAELIETGDFELIRKCENPVCTLWFYDRTKAHRRRWCSMAACGTRHNSAAYRVRRKH